MVNSGSKIQRETYRGRIGFRSTPSFAKTLLLVNLFFLLPAFIGYEPFCEAIRNLFGNDVSTQDLKALFRKIALNPDAQVDWSEVILLFTFTRN